jgi:hypothetical protein
MTSKATQRNLSARQHEFSRNPESIAFRIWLAVERAHPIVYVGIISVKAG